MEESRLRTYSPQTLAFLGDAVYSLYMREYVVLNANCPAHKLHNRTIKYVSAPAQAMAIDAIEPELSEEERDIYRRGLNTKTANSAKNSSKEEYHKATGFESLIGWLQLKGDEKRIKELIEKAIEINGKI
ncbi:MAG: ribonuclease III [Lachnospiraceae bacterium]|nr:ribonuclease III [Lachnospiraceae bacterium]MDN4743681.1 ribonuclease III domain-containing protein [Lachnospiraceae bacterium C1.1]